MLVFNNVHLSFKEYAWLNLRYTLRTQPVLLPMFLLPLAVVVCWLAVLLGPVNLAQLLGNYGVLLLTVTLFALVLPFSMWRNLKRNYLLSKILQAPATYVFEEASIRAESPYVQATVTWENVPTAYLSPPYAIVLLGAAGGYFLDFRCLQAPATEANFRQLLQRHNVQLK